MLISKEVDMNILCSNVNYYVKLGYDIPKKFNSQGKEIFDLPCKLPIKVEDLPLGSGVNVHIKCDFCGKDIYPTYCNYNRTLKKYKEYNIDSCYECKKQKIKLMQNIKLQNNMIDKDGHGYWCDKNNLIKEFNEYFNQYGNFTGMNKNKYGMSIINGLQKHNENITSMALQLGYSIQDIGRVPKGYYNNFDVFKEDIIKLINKLGRFPTILEIQNNLKIGSITIQKHGGMREIKKKMNYDKNNNLLDDNNYYNASSYEYMTAQFLIHNINMSYERNVIISSEDGRFNCDFRAIINHDNNEEYLWIEVWGGYGGNKFKGVYDKTHDIKMELYNKFNCQLVSLYPSDFDNKSYEEIQDMLYEKFKPYIDLNYKYIDNKIISTYKNISDAEILQELMKYSIDGYYLPSDAQIQKLDNRLYREVYKRFGNFGKMAEQFNIIDRLKSKPAGYWSEERLINYLVALHNKYGIFLSRDEIDKNAQYCEICKNFISSFDRMHKYGGKVMIQLKCLYNNLHLINNYDLLYLHRIVNNYIKCNSEQQDLAKQILEKYNQTDYKQCTNL